MSKKLKHGLRIHQLCMVMSVLIGLSAIMACGGGDNGSDSADKAAPATIATPSGGSYNSSQNVTLTCNDGSGSGCAATYYTIDGSEPTTSSAAYTNPINIDADTTLKFFSMDNANNREAIKTESYIIDTAGPAIVRRVNFNVRPWVLNNEPVMLNVEFDFNGKTVIAQLLPDQLHATLNEFTGNTNLQSNSRLESFLAKDSPPEPFSTYNILVRELLQLSPQGEAISGVLEVNRPEQASTTISMLNSLSADVNLACFNNNAATGISQNFTWTEFENLWLNNGIDDCLRVASFAYKMLFVTSRQNFETHNIIESLNHQRKQFEASGSGNVLTPFNCETLPATGQAGNMQYTWNDQSDDGMVGAGDSFVISYNQCWINRAGNNADRLLNGTLLLFNYSESEDSMAFGFNPVGLAGLEVIKTRNNGSSLSDDVVTLRGGGFDIELEIEEIPLTGQMQINWNIERADINWNYLGGIFVGQTFNNYFGVAGSSGEVQITTHITDTSGNTIREESNTLQVDIAAHYTLSAQITMTNWISCNQNDTPFILKHTSLNAAPNTFEIPIRSVFNVDTLRWECPTTIGLGKFGIKQES